MDSLPHSQWLPIPYHILLKCNLINFDAIYFPQPTYLSSLIKASSLTRGNRLPVSSIHHKKFQWKLLPCQLFLFKLFNFVCYYSLGPLTDFRPIDFLTICQIYIRFSENVYPKEMYSLLSFGHDPIKNHCHGNHLCLDIYPLHFVTTDNTL